MKKYKVLLLVLSILFSSIYGIKAQSILRPADNLFRDCQYENALNEYKKGIKKLKSNRVEIQRATFQIAECYRIMGDLKKAERMSERTIRESPNNPVFLDTYGWIMHLQGQDELAKFYLQKALENATEENKNEIIKHINEIRPLR